jgi:Putative beta barrel porin-7 (BBP7)
VRFVARLAIAIATLITSAIFCWGQPPLGAPVRSNVDAGAARGVSYIEEPPASAEGAWVADDDVEEFDESATEPPGQLGLGSYEVDGPYDGSVTEECDCEECRAAAEACDPDAHHRHGLFACSRCRGADGGGLCGPLWCSDLWNDVHAHRRVYVQADYLSFWTKGNLLPPLVTTSPLGTPQSQAGVLPVSATTAILFGDERVDMERRNGGRINVGYWLIDGEFLGVEGQYFALQTGDTTFNAVSDFSGGDPNAQILARPFFNVDPNLITPRQDSLIVAFPAGFVIGNGAGTGTLDGGINIRTTSNLQSAGGLMRKLVWIDFTMQRRVDLLLGYRFFRIDDSVIVNDQSTFIPSSGVVPQTEFTSQDVFSSRNEFHGGEIGLKAQSYHGRLSLEFIGKCAFGNNRQRTYINGFNTVTPLNGATTVFEGGFLTQPTNIGTHVRNVFAVLPEADVNLRFDITCNLRATIGYTFLYMNRVQRSGDAIDTTINPTQFDGEMLDGDPRPAFSPKDTTYWAHGATAGIEYRW